MCTFALFVLIIALALGLENFISAIFRTRTNSTYYKSYIEMKESWLPRNLKSMESLVRTKTSVICSVYNVTPLFRNLQKRYITCSEHDTLQTRCSGPESGFSFKTGHLPFIERAPLFATVVRALCSYVTLISRRLQKYPVTVCIVHTEHITTKPLINL